MAAASSAAWFTYAEQLVGRGYGLPLWHPEPTKYGEDRCEVEIGDVGYVSEGRFIRIFNAMRSKDDPVNVGGVPKGFVILEPSGRHFFSEPEQISPGPICTATTTYRKANAEVSDSAQLVSASYAFSCHSNRGAIAVLGDFGHQEWYNTNRAFWNYIAKHHASWCEFAAEQDYLVPPEAIILVSGWLKTTEWAIASVANYGKTHDFSFTASAGSYASAGFELSASTDVQMSMEQRSGPRFEAVSPQPMSDGSVRRPKPPCNQCLFLRYYKLKARPLGLGRGVDVKVDAKDAIGPGDEYSPSRRPPGPGSGSSSQGSSSCFWGFFGGTRSNAPQNDSDNPRSGSNGTDDHYVEVEEDPSSASRTAIPDPLDDLLDLILERHPGANAAVLCHEDFYSIIAPDKYPNGVPDDIREAASQEMLSQGLDICINDNGVAFVGKDKDPRAAIQKDSSGVKAHTYNYLNMELVTETAPSPSSFSRPSSPESDYPEIDTTESTSLMSPASTQATTAVEADKDQSSLRSTPQSSSAVELANLPSTGRGGCWTCRVRRKKCDEERGDGDSCRTCRRLQIDCLGWGPRRPDWMRDKEKVTEYKANIKAQLARLPLVQGQPATVYPSLTWPSSVISQSSASSSSSDRYIPEALTAPRPSTVPARPLANWLSGVRPTFF